MSLAETLRGTLRQEGGEYQGSDGLKKDICVNRLTPHDTFSIPDITVYEIDEYISSVGSIKTPGCDGISNRIILISLPYIVQHLTYIYNLNVEHFPFKFENCKGNPASKSQRFYRHQ